MRCLSSKSSCFLAVSVGAHAQQVTRRRVGKRRRTMVTHRMCTVIHVCLPLDRLVLPKGLETLRTSASSGLRDRSLGRRTQLSRYHRWNMASKSRGRELGFSQAPCRLPDTAFSTLITLLTHSPPPRAHPPQEARKTPRPRPPNSMGFRPSRVVRRQRFLLLTPPAPPARRPGLVEQLERPVRPSPVFPDFPSSPRAGEDLALPSPSPSRVGASRDRACGARAKPLWLYTSVDRRRARTLGRTPQPTGAAERCVRPGPTPLARLSLQLQALQRDRPTPL